MLRFDGSTEQTVLHSVFVGSRSGNVFAQLFLFCMLHYFCEIFEESVSSCWH